MGQGGRLTLACYWLFSSPDIVGCQVGPQACSTNFSFHKWTAVPLFGPTKKREEGEREAERGTSCIKGQIKWETAGLKVTSHCPNSSFKTTKEVKNTTLHSLFLSFSSCPSLIILSLLTPPSLPLFLPSSLKEALNIARLPPSLSVSLPRFFLYLTHSFLAFPSLHPDATPSLSVPVVFASSDVFKLWLMMAAVG